MGSAHKNLILSELLPTVFGQLVMLSGESRQKPGRGIVCGWRGLIM